MHPQGYRTEIDGLRALAVLLVLLNHAEIPPFVGGFLGVDVFFVISGYLITSVILRELTSDIFSYRAFLERRARRILPALFAMLVPVTLVASLVLVGRDRDHFFRSLIAVSSFWSNIRFFLDVGYFDVDAVFKPLLHTWSLGIEEQFYLLLPLLLGGLSRRSSVQRTSVVLVLTVASLLTMSLVSQPAAFYLLPARAWELLCGSLLVLLRLDERVRRLRLRRPGLLTGHFDLLGVFAIVLPSLFLDKNSAWPSALTLLPVMGTVLVLAAATPDSRAGKLLSVRPLVVIGLCSYSVYLWHYPIFSLVRYRNGGFGWDTKLLLSAASIIVGWASWRCVESPFRGHGRFRQRHIFLGSLIGCGAFLGVGGVHAAVSERLGRSADPEISTQDAPIMMIGDSHAQHLVPGLLPYVGDLLTVSWSPGCVPFWGVDRFDYRFERGACAEFSTNALRSAIESDRVKVVVLASMGPVYVTGETFRGFDQDRVTEDGLVLVENPELTDRWKVFETGLRDTLRRLSISGKKTVVVVDVPELGIPPQNCEPDEPTTCENPRSEINRRTNRYRELVHAVSSEFSGVTVFDSTELFCSDQVCIGATDGRALYADVDHLSEYGSQYVGDVLGPLLVRIMKTP